LGGDLDVNGNTITSASNGNIVINPHGTGDIVVGAEIVSQDTNQNIEITPNGTGKVITSKIQSATAGDVNLSLDTSGTGTIDANSNRITSVADPTLAQDAATKAYVDAEVGAIGTPSSISTLNTSVVTSDTGTNGTITFTTDGTTAMTVDNNQRLGIGTASPVHKLMVEGTAGTGDFANGTLLNLSGGSISAADTGVGIVFTRSGSQMAYIHARRENDSDEAGYLAFATQTSGGTHPERMRIDSSGRLGLGTSSPETLLHLSSATGSASPTPTELRIATTTDASDWSTTDPWGRISFYAADTSGSGPKVHASIDTIAANTPLVSSSLAFRTTRTDDTLAISAVIDNAGRVGIGTTSPGALLTLRDAAPAIRLTADANDVTELQFGDTGDEVRGNIVFRNGTGGNALCFHTNNNNERARIDSAGRLLVGGSSSRDDFYVPSTYNPQIQNEGISLSTSMISNVANSNNPYGSYLILGKSRGTAPGSNTIVQNGDTVGIIDFLAADGTQLTHSASIAAIIDGTPGTADMPTRLVFATTADGASGPTERMRIRSTGMISMPDTGGYVSNIGHTFDNNGSAMHVTNNDYCLLLNRRGSDGDLVQFRQGDSQEGTISVSGSTVSYNGAHLSRWSQLPGGAERTEILRGSVLSNIDEMCEWSYEAQPAVLWEEGDGMPEGVSVGDVRIPAKEAGTESNEQLNRMKVSDVEGDCNVSGVFQGWDDNDDTYTNDFYCAMTGDFVIRIAQGVTVQRGDLLMSAGDGTAKPQDDDIIRSKTIAKVTSTHVSETYADGSYCVPCVLMAC